MKVTFYSPGTFVPEETVLETHEVEPNKIAELARTIIERHGARPFGFQLETDPGVTYWLGGEILTYDQIPDTEENKILRWNMKYNNIERVIVNTNSWRHTAVFKENDVLLEFQL